MSRLMRYHYVAKEETAYDGQVQLHGDRQAICRIRSTFTPAGAWQSSSWDKTLKLRCRRMPPQDMSDKHIYEHAI